MKFVLSHRTAAFATHIPAVRRALSSRPSTSLGLPLKIDVGDAQLAALQRMLGVEERLCCGVFRDEDRRQSERHFAKILRSQPGEEAFIQLGGGLYLPCPELTFLQMASELDLLELIRFGFDLCGTYIPGRGSTETTYDVEPLSTAGKLAAFCEKHLGRNGGAKALRATRFVIDRCASPQESNLAMRLCLPFRLGGYAAPKAVANVKFDAARGRRVPDLLWRRLRLEVEYDSAEFHTDATRDAIRRNQLQSELRVMTVTTEMAKSLEMMDEFALDFYNAAGLTFRPTSKNYEQRKLELHRCLMSPEWYRRKPEGRYAL